MKLETPEGRELETTSNQSKFRDYSVSRIDGGYKLVLTWEDLKFGDASYPASVQAAVIVRHDSPLTTSRIQIENQGTAPLSQVVFPLITRVQELNGDGAEDVLAYPSRGGLERSFSTDVISGACDAVDARAVGITAIWLNRQGRPRLDNANPDYEIGNFLELTSILTRLRRSVHSCW
ncbi:MAG: hypothetical protein HYY02_06300 [Chloroflexi bacterium]|nr:hypothetical protein [Chloroflexota bacterium]